MQEFLLQASDLDTLIQAIRREGHRLLGPVLRDGTIVYDDVTTADDLPKGWTDRQEKAHYRTLPREDGAYFGYVVGPHAWKKFLQLPRRQIWNARRSGDNIQILEVEDPAPPMAFLGVRSCDLHAIAIQDRVFVEDEYRNDSYTRRRSQLFIVAVNCTSSAPTCFCTSMNTGPEVTLPTDLTLTEVLDGEQHFFLIASGSERGARILAQLPVRPAGSQQRQQASDAIAKTAAEVAKGPRSFDSGDLKELIYRNLDSPSWDQVAERCLSCANCTMACPTCFCSTVEDTTDLSGDNAQRWERWDSCFTGDFSYISGGAVRPDTRSRYRQWMSHKLATWHDQFDSSGCVGCGRCITWCPVGIDITEEVQRIRESETR
ncbi:4Fe-4S dicluster domain-containing protein [Microbulbifer hydrolyticus]|uniref:Ferredoxin n=1 Tax=Microbulbifer hydrolyticus TaxID=48074 RepID=A0A6P1T8H6_9GAMM|nr:4Fe-4S dicluster domain-containing protein [Microbulbifer hydrolyticus]MBB5210428.1 ferredoxin [Microbulbifer hydrolyticus]QHQ39088.1 sulfite reductase subunit A [Microbulbifer hydrolyticus]